MKFSPDQAANLWDRFLKRWPLGTLKDITLEQYAALRTGNDESESFTYWLESKTEELGSIWGGSAFKFGIYKRSNTEEKASAQGRIYGAQYAWYEKYGPTPEVAFEAVKREIIKVAKAAREGDTQTIEKADLGYAVKWKLAFLYQPVETPYLLPIFSLDVLRLLAGRKDVETPELHRELLKQRGGKSIFEYAKELWTKGEAIIESQEEMLSYLKERFSPIKEPVKYIAGFVTKNGRHLALARELQQGTVYVEPGDWEQLVPGVILKLRYAPADPRSSNLKANAPRLDVGHAVDRLIIPSKAVLAAFCDVYDDFEEEGDSQMSTQMAIPNSSKPNVMTTTCVNKILYGPPGTGKTFKTAELAVALCNGSVSEDREKLMAEYEELRKGGRIRFVTFHQSYGYEEFVEGLRPEVKNGQVTYSVRPGVFREACEAARRSQLVRPGLSGKPLSERTVYKMSLGVAGTEEGRKVFQDSIANGVVLLGWGDDIDFTECKGNAAIREKVSEVSGTDRPDSHVRFVSAFKDEIQVGDLIIVSQGNSAFRAIAEVTGEYQYLESPMAGRFHQSRRVRWLAVFESNRPVEEIYTKGFVQPSLYKLMGEHLKIDALETLIDEQVQGAKQDFVLIIDEINRANISKVFGELITLLEADKREGAVNGVTLKLPYSGEIGRAHV